MSFQKLRDAARGPKLPDELRFVLRTTGQRPKYEQPFRLRLVLRIVHYPVQPELPFVERTVAEENAQVVIQEATSTFNTNASRKRATFPIKRVQTYDLHRQRTIYPRRSWTCWSATGPPWPRSGNSNGRSRTAGADFPLETAPSSWTRPAPVVPARRSPISTFSLGTATPRQKTKKQNIKKIALTCLGDRRTAARRDSRHIWAPPVSLGISCAASWPVQSTFSIRLVRVLVRSACLR